MDGWTGRANVFADTLGTKGSLEWLRILQLKAKLQLARRSKNKNIFSTAVLDIASDVCLYFIFFFVQVKDAATIIAI